MGLFGSQMADYGTSEITLAKEVLAASLQPGMLCLADRNFFGFELWGLARDTGADLLWRIKKNLRLACEERLPDGSYLSRIDACDNDRRHKTNGIEVRVIDYRLDGVADAEPIYRLVTSLLDHEQAPATELAALYHERWEIETALGELKTHLRGAGVVLRSKTPDLVRQEFHGLPMAHFAIRGLIHEAALKPMRIPTDCPSSMRFVSSGASSRPSPPFPPHQRTALHDAVLEEILQERVASSRGRRVPRGVKRKMSNFPLRRRGDPSPPLLKRDQAIKIVKSTALPLGIVF